MSPLRPPDPGRLPRKGPAPIALFSEDLEAFVTAISPEEVQVPLPFDLSKESQAPRACPSGGPSYRKRKQRWPVLELCRIVSGMFHLFPRKISKGFGPRMSARTQSSNLRTDSVRCFPSHVTRNSDSTLILTLTAVLSRALRRTGAVPPGPLLLRALRVRRRGRCAPCHLFYPSVCVSVTPPPM